MDRGREVLWRVTVGLQLNARTPLRFPGVEEKKKVCVCAFDDSAHSAYV
jgi:hypothetical protein